ncbi:MAG: MBL fold metallo-hydrolase [Gammaproteobacteria bacterium]|nr:MBL fold metallo-hydrolase [Gammaproteobacteria bacterium]
MTDLFKLSDKIIREGVANEPVNRVNFELSEIANGIAMVEAFSHSIVFATDDGLVTFDTSAEFGGQPVVKAIRGWNKDRFHSLVYTHGHVDHVGGSGAFVQSERDAKRPDPAVIGHENISARFDRYNMTNGYNLVVNKRQFGRAGMSNVAGMNPAGLTGGPTFLPKTAARPDITFKEEMSLSVGGLEIKLKHAKGETDDHAWAWIPEHKAICAGDFFIWNFPNAGNPQKVQRFPVEWAAAMRDMASMNAEMLLPAHGLPIRGSEQIKAVLEDSATALEGLVRDTLEMMNAGATKNDIVHAVSVSQELLDKPYLRPLYDEPEFVVNNIWRLYGGWYDGNPANLKPARESELASEIAQLSGGSIVLAERAEELAAAGDFRLACHLIELAVQSDFNSKQIHGIRAKIYKQRRKIESSLMAKGIFGYAARESSSKSE